MSIDMMDGIRKGDIRPVYLFCGSERLLLEDALKEVETIIVEPATKVFNFTLFEGPGTSSSMIVDAARTLPMMARRRLVVVKDVDRMPASELDGLLSYIKDPSVSTCLVLVAEKPDMRKGLFSALKDSVVKFEPLQERQLPKWIRREAEASGKKIGEEAALYLSETFGSDLLRLRNEIEKAVLYAGEKREIDLSDVEAVAAKGRLKSIFALTDAVGNRDAGNALKILDSLLNNGENGVYILYMVTRQLRQIWVVKELLDAGRRSDAICSEARIAPFVYKAISAQVKKFSTADLREAFPILLEADASLKSGRLNERLILESLILKISSDASRQGRVVRKP